jgi:hypothetical protein
MFDLRESRILNIIAHKTGFEGEEPNLELSNEVLKLDDDFLKELLLRYFLESFKVPEYFTLVPQEGDYRNNKIFAAASDVFSNADFFYAQSLHIGKAYGESGYDKPGLLFVVHFSLYGNEEASEALGIFRAEQKEYFMKADKEAWGTSLDYLEGYNLQKPDKACIILNTNKGKGFKLCVAEKGNRSQWRDEFLKVKPFSDNFHFTKQMMEVTKDFVTRELKKEFEVSKADQIDILNKSVEYFKTSDKFEEEEFAASVFGDQEVIGSFKKYKEEVESGSDFSFEEAFDISVPAVKKQARVFKSVLKLDKNFHIYIHGNREMIEKGVDDNGKKYYKIYYEQEE